MDQTTQTLIALIPPSGHGTIAAVQSLLHQQYIRDMLTLATSAVGLQGLNWFVTWFSKNTPAPPANASLLEKFWYALLQKVADITASHAVTAPAPPETPTWPPRASAMQSPSEPPKP